MKNKALISIATTSSNLHKGISIILFWIFEISLIALVEEDGNAQVNIIFRILGLGLGLTLYKTKMFP